MQFDFAPLTSKLSAIRPITRYGRVIGVDSGSIRIEGLSLHARVGDQITISADAGDSRGGEVVALAPDEIRAMSYDSPQGVAIGDLVSLDGISGAAASPGPLASMAPSLTAASPTSSTVAGTKPPSAA